MIVVRIEYFNFASLHKSLPASPLDAQKHQYVFLCQNPAPEQTAQK